MSSSSFSEWIWSSEHGQYYCYRYNNAGGTEYRWKGALQNQNDSRGSQNQGRGSRATTTQGDYSSTYSSSTGFDEGDRGSSIYRASSGTQHGTSEYGRDRAARGSEAGRSGNQGRSLIEDRRRLQDGDEVFMPTDDGGQLVRTSFLIRRGRIDDHGQWEYQLWHENGTLYDGGHWFKGTELT